MAPFWGGQGRPAIPAPGSALRSHPCGAVPSAQVRSVETELSGERIQIEKILPELLPARYNNFMSWVGPLAGFAVTTEVKGEVDWLERAIQEAPRNLDELEQLLTPGSALDESAVLNMISNSCPSACRALACNGALVKAAIVN